MKHAFLALALAAGFGCVAVYPEVGTQLHSAVQGQRLDPPPPDDLRWVKFVSARVPEKTRDGRPWHTAFGKLPDPYAKLFVNGTELVRSPVQTETLTPTWPNGPHGNFKIGDGDKVRVELWDANPINDQPIGVREFGRITRENLEDRKIDVELEGGAEIRIALEPAHAMSGLGLWYELRTTSVFITRMLDDSPAKRAGILPGDEVVALAGKPVKSLNADEVRSLFNAVPFDGLALGLRHASGARLDVKLKEGPIYPPFDQFGSVD
ncbi:MAG TPA: PDZ domain-containing protein [Minicystis sp.]|nr:PDZ domain-containing protein [Minicystis sp.]